MTTWCWNEPKFASTPAGNALIGNDVIEADEAGILTLYWEFWKGLMEKKYGAGSHHITEEACIEDFVLANWAWRKETVGM